MRYGALSAAIALALLLAFPAAAHTQACGAYDDGAEAFGRLWGERVVSSWFDEKNGIVYELWVNKASGTVTVVGVEATGFACEVAGGEYYEERGEEDKPVGGSI